MPDLTPATPRVAFSYPKLKYRQAEEYPGYTHAKVADPVEEEALGEGWHDTPGEMLAAAAAIAEAAMAAEVAAEPDPKPRRKA